MLLFAQGTRLADPVLSQTSMILPLPPFLSLRPYNSRPLLISIPFNSAKKPLKHFMRRRIRGAIVTWSSCLGLIFDPPADD
jgi:hypothetical protein